jgi:hypothetical protein
VVGPAIGPELSRAAALALRLLRLDKCRGKLEGPMLVSALLIAMGEPAAAQPAPAPMVIDLMRPACPEDASEADVVVCAQRTPDYRIDPGVLASQRAREPQPSETTERQRSAMASATSCHDLPTKCQGSGVIPLLPAALKAIEAAALAVKGEDWREAFRTKPDEYQAYQAERRRSGVRVGVGVSAGAGSRPGQ